MSLSTFMPPMVGRDRMGKSLRIVAIFVTDSVLDTQLQDIRVLTDETMFLCATEKGSFFWIHAIYVTLEDHGVGPAS